MEEIEFKEGLSPDVSTCQNFLSELGEEKEVTAIIVPVRVKREGGSQKNKITISWACNHGRKCFRSSCIYAKGDMEV